MFMIPRSLAAGVMLICVACSSPIAVREVTIPSHEQDQPDSFVEEITYEPTGSFYNEEMCVVVSQQALWSPGDIANRLRQQIISSVKVTIDGQDVDKISSSSFLVLHFMIEDGEEVGTYGDPLDMCFSLTGLSSGQHTGQIQITASSGQVFSETWAFVTE
jgi:hypothetical protein